MADKRIPRRVFGVQLSSMLGAGMMLGGEAMAKVPAAGEAGSGVERLPWTTAQPGDGKQRLSEATHALAAKALGGEYGQAMRPAGFGLSEQERRTLSPNALYARALAKVAEQAPLRITPGEKIVGSATLLEAAQHMMPLAAIPSTSHTTIGFSRVLGQGYRGLRRQIDERLKRAQSEPAAERERVEDLLRSMLACLDAASAWHRRHMQLLDERIAQSSAEERKTYESVRLALSRVPENPPETFHEALQSLWFMYAFQRLAGNWSGIGRIDEMLGPYLEADLKAGRLTMDEARELVAHFWIKGCEWTGADGGGRGSSGDAQFYQNIILAGVDCAGREVTNEVTYLVLDVVEELHISDFPIAVRLNRKSPKRLLERIADVQRRGGGIVATYNEEVILEGLVKFGYKMEEARGFTNDGCWEVLIPGRTAFIYVPFDALALLHEVLGLLSPGKPAPRFADFEALYAAYQQRLAQKLDEVHRGIDGVFQGGPVSPLLSMFVEDCIERGRGYHERGARYTVVAPHAGGLANVSNSLQVLKRLVYEEKFLTYGEFVEVLRSDWKDSEALRRLIMTRFEFYGNDDDEADAMMRRVFDDYAGLASKVRERAGVLRPVGVSTFGREIEWAVGPQAQRRASPDGQRLGAILATNCSPSPGTERHGPTAALASYCKLDFTKTPNGATLELKLHPASVAGEPGRQAMVALMRSFVRLGGMFLHIDVVDSAMLLDAQRHPEKYPNLSVRIAGWSARFATMNKQWQDMVIQRTQHLL